MLRVLNNARRKISQSDIHVPHSSAYIHRRICELRVMIAYWKSYQCYSTSGQHRVRHRYRACTGHHHERERISICMVTEVQGLITR